MPAVSRAQQHFMGMCAHADHPPARCPKMARQKMLEFARTKTRGLPKRVGLSAALSAPDPMSAEDRRRK